MISISSVDSPTSLKERRFEIAVSIRSAILKSPLLRFYCFRPIAASIRQALRPVSHSLHMSRGVFITFEGSEGCGKSTQVSRLAARLEHAGVRTLVTREPGGTAIGEKIRHLLQFAPESFAMTPETELLLFEASRSQLVRETIAPALEQGIAVISDRFFDSTTVYQGVARKLSPEIVETLNAFAVGNARPDLTFILDVSVETARARMRRRVRPVAVADRMEQEPVEFYERVCAGYRELAKR